MEIRLGARLGDFLDNSTAYLAMKGANKIEMEADRSLAFNAQLNLEYEGRPRNSLLIAQVFTALAYILSNVPTIRIPVFGY